MGINRPVAELENQPRGTHRPPPELRERVAALLRAVGIRAAARRLRMNRDPLLAVAAGLTVREGTLLLLQKRLAESEAA